MLFLRITTRLFLLHSLCFIIIFLFKSFSEIRNCSRSWSYTLVLHSFFFYYYFYIFIIYRILGTKKQLKALKSVLKRIKIYLIFFWIYYKSFNQRHPTFFPSAFQASDENCKVFLQQNEARIIFAHQWHENLLNQ